MKIKMSSARNKILLFFLILNIGLIFATAIFAAVFRPWELIEANAPSSCVFQRALGLYCPGCGGTRAVGYLLSLDIINAFIHFPPLFVGIGLVIWIDILFIYSFKKDSLHYIQNHRYYEFLLIPISLLLLFFIRNILLKFGIDPLGDFSR